VAPAVQAAAIMLLGALPCIKNHFCKTKMIARRLFYLKKKHNTAKSSPQHAFELKGCSRGYGELLFI